MCKVYSCTIATFVVVKVNASKKNFVYTACAKEYKEKIIK